MRRSPAASGAALSGPGRGQRWRGAACLARCAAAILPGGLFAPGGDIAGAPSAAPFRSGPGACGHGGAAGPGGVEGLPAARPAGGEFLPHQFSELSGFLSIGAAGTAGMALSALVPQRHINNPVPDPDDSRHARGTRLRACQGLGPGGGYPSVRRFPSRGSGRPRTGNWCPGGGGAASTDQVLREMVRPGPILEKKTVWCKNGPI